MDKKNLYFEPKSIDNITRYGKGFEPEIDQKTEFERESSYKTCDGKEVVTMEEVK